MLGRVREIGQPKVKCEQDDDRDDVDPRMRKRARDHNLCKCHNRVECMLADVRPSCPLIRESSIRKSAPEHGYHGQVSRVSDIPMLLNKCAYR